MKKTGLLTLLSTAVVVAAIANGPYLFATQQSTDYNPQAVLQADTMGIAPGDTIVDVPVDPPVEVPADSLAAIVTESSVELTFTNDGNHPWTVEDGYIMSASMEKYTASTMSFSFQTDETVELSFIGININGDNHRSEIYVDGAFYKSITSGSENNVRMFLKPGSHIVMFRDSISGWFYDNQQTTLRNLRIRDIVPLETLPLMEGSLPLTFTNDVSGYPWTVEDGYLQNGNHTFANSVSRFSTTFTIDTVSWFRFERQVTPYNTYWGNNTNLSYQYLYTRINGELAMTDWDNSGFDMFETVLEPGTYTVEWTDTIANTTSPYYARIRNIGVPLAHTSIAFQSTLKGLRKLLLHEEAIKADLDGCWAVVAEAIQTVLRREGYPHPYETLKALTRTNAAVTHEDIAGFIDTLNVDERVKAELRNITPYNYTGI